MHLMSGELDPAYTLLEIGADYINRPRRYPCDAFYACDPTLTLTTVGKAGIAVAVTLVGLITAFLIVWFLQREGLSHPADKERT